MSVVTMLLNSLGLEYRWGKIIKKKAPNEYHKAVRTLEEGNAAISELIQKDTPALVGRIGLVELWLILNYLEYSDKSSVCWDEYVTKPIWKHTGIFPVENEALKLFAETYLDAIGKMDIVGVWNNIGENEVIRRFCPMANLIPLESIEPYFFEKPWSNVLEGKSVLVLHPFEQSIVAQYQNNRTKLFQNERVLPQFDLKTVRAVQTLSYNTGGFSNWTEAFQFMKKKIDAEDFDIAIVGAGGYGLPLAAYIKSIGKTAIHMGGATQILFGIKGNRWESRNQFRKLFNEYWKKPEPEEMPANAMIVEDGAYW